MSLIAYISSIKNAIKRHNGGMHIYMFFILFLSSIPVLIVSTPPLFDYPNHLARAYIIGSFAASATFQSHFELAGFLIPNVLADILLLILMQVVDVLTAGRILLVLTFITILSGTYALSRVLTGRYTIWPLFAAALLYNEMLLWGFLNYLLGLGLLLWAVAAWLHFEGHSRVWQVVVGSCLALVVFFAHLVVFGLYGVAIAAIELRRIALLRPQAGAALRRLALSAAQFVPAAAIFFVLSPSSGLDAAPRFDFSLFGKVMPFTRILSSGNTALDVLSVSATVGFLAYALLTRRVFCHGVLLLVAGLFLLLVLSLPYTLLGSYYLDSRIVIAAALVLVASLHAKPDTEGFTRIAAIVLMVIVSARTAGLLEDWRAQERHFVQVLEALDTVPRGSVIVTAVGHHFELGDWTTTRRIKPSHEHTTHYATIRRDALVLNVFARRGQNPLVFSPSLDALNRVARNPVPRVFAAADAHRLIETVGGLAEMQHAARPPIPGVFIIGYHVPCDIWPENRSLSLIRCDPTFSLVRVLGKPASEEEEEEGTIRPEASP